MNITTEQIQEAARLVDEAVKAGTYAGTMTTIGAIVIALGLSE